MTQNAPLAVGLDIGTTKIVAVVGRLDEHGKIDVLGIGKSQYHLDYRKHSSSR